MTELRARLKATSAAFQTRENSVAELREAVHHLRLDLRLGQEKTKAQARKLEEQVTFFVFCGCIGRTGRLLVFLLLYWWCVAVLLASRVILDLSPRVLRWICNTNLCHII